MRAAAIMQACLAWWNVVSPLGGWGSTLALAFVLIVAAIKAVWEDGKRHQEDGRTNSSVAHRYMPDGIPTPNKACPSQSIRPHQDAFS